MYLLWVGFAQLVGASLITFERKVVCMYLDTPSPNGYSPEGCFWTHGAGITTDWDASLSLLVAILWRSNCTWGVFSLISSLFKSWRPCSANLVGGVPTHSGRLELGDLQGQFQPKPFYVLKQILLFHYYMQIHLVRSRTGSLSDTGLCMQ